MRNAADDQIWEHALEKDFLITTKDEDFRKMSHTRGSPPKVVLLRLGNCSVADLELVLRTHADDLRAFAFNSYQAILSIE